MRVELGAQHSRDMFEGEAAEGIQAFGSVVELGPIIVLDHIDVGVIDVAALILVAPEGGSGVLRAGWSVCIEISE